jgi:hypothetical protein
MQVLSSKNKKSEPVASNTHEQYRAAIAEARQTFIAKNQDYGTAWRILRISSLVDQLFIKARRIRSIEENHQSAVNEGIESEYKGLVNYAALALIQDQLPEDAELELPFEEVLRHYDTVINEAWELMNKKNTDYGEAWREMWITSLTDLILMKLLRIRKLLTQDAEDVQSEGIDANLYDIINYSVFALIKIAAHHESNHNRS